MKINAKVWVVGVVLMLVGYGLYGYTNSDDYRGRQYTKMIERLSAEDVYGGATPEETLALFIAALKKGDTDLASKYFLRGEWEKWSRELRDNDTKNSLPDLVAKLEALKLSANTDDKTARFQQVGSDKKLISELVMHRNPLTQRWKITRL